MIDQNFISQCLFMFSRLPFCCLLFIYINCCPHSHDVYKNMSSQNVNKKCDNFILKEEYVKWFVNKKRNKFTLQQRMIFLSSY